MDGVQVQEFVLVIVDGQAPDVQQVLTNVWLYILRNMCSKAKSWNTQFIYIISAICNPHCVNGICSRPGLCTCSSGWVGGYCQIGKLHSPGLLQLL